MNATDAEFMELWRQHKSPAKVAKAMGTNLRNVYRRRDNLAEKYNMNLDTHKEVKTWAPPAPKSELGIENGTVIVFSDAHFWPGIRTTAFQGLLWAAALTKYIEFQISNNSSVLVAPETYKTTYSTNMAEEVNKILFCYVFIFLFNQLIIKALLLGAVSLCLTLLNIFCIVLMGIIVLKVKNICSRK